MAETQTIPNSFNSITHADDIFNPSSVDEFNIGHMEDPFPSSAVDDFGGFGDSWA